MLFKENLVESSLLIKTNTKSVFEKFQKQVFFRKFYVTYLEKNTILFTFL